MKTVRDIVLKRTVPTPSDAAVAHGTLAPVLHRSDLA